MTMKRCVILFYFHRSKSNRLISVWSKLSPGMKNEVFTFLNFDWSAFLEIIQFVPPNLYTSLPFADQSTQRWTSASFIWELMNWRMKSSERRWRLMLFVDSWTKPSTRCSTNIKKFLIFIWEVLLLNLKSIITLLDRHVCK